MSRESFGVIDDDRTYTPDQIASILGRRERWAREWIRAHCEHADLGNGLLLVSGRRFRLAIEKMSQFREEN